MTAAIFASRHVLIVDDHVALAENIAEILQLDGHRTSVAASAEEALSTFFDHEPDVVVTDYHLPGLNGAEVVRRFRGKWMNVRTVIVSGHSDEEIRREASAAGASFFPKPIDFQRLVHLVGTDSTSAA